VAAEAELEALLAEIEDRFGPPPEPLRNLVELARLRLRAEALGIESLESEAGVLAVKFSSRPRIEGDKLIALLHGREDVSFDRAGVLKVRMGGARPLLAEAASLLEGLG
jgi:transcription-repair coupling factor (superfamily II helicase)